jgi:hypothetical protein
MPGAPQLLSSGPFTPPRIVSYPLSSGVNNGRSSELPSIKDDGENPSHTFTFTDSDFSTTFLTPPSSTYNPSGVSPDLLSGSSSSEQSGFDFLATEPFNPAGPLPNPAFSFGNAPMVNTGSGGQQTEEEAKMAQAMYDAFREGGRLDSLASLGSVGSGGTFNSDGTSGTAGDGDFGLDFNPNRRASA